VTLYSLIALIDQVSTTKKPYFEKEFIQVVGLKIGYMALTDLHGDRHNVERKL